MAKYQHWYILFFIFSVLVLASCEKNDDGDTTSNSDTSSDNNMLVTLNIHVPSDPVTTQIPLKYDGLMSVIECELNGITCKMMLDTGADTIALFEDKLKKFDLKTIGVTQGGYTAGGAGIETRVIEKFVIEFPDHIKVATNNCTTMPPFYNKPDIDGIIGAPIFVILKATIDYDKKVLILKGSGTSQSVNNESNMSDSNNIVKESNH
ncbi:MAG: aspartyl protease family protein [Planctomycetota bacterium]